LVSEREVRKEVGDDEGKLLKVAGGGAGIVEGGFGREVELTVVLS
jgi:hypothetical protein